jgi:hypothetical protein
MFDSPFMKFFIMFKSNSPDVEKDMKKLQKTSDETTKSIKKSNEASAELGKSFTDAVETGVRAVAAYASFTAIKNNIINTNELNRSLTIQARLWGQNANEIGGYMAAAKAAGGSGEGLLGWYAGQVDKNAQIGRKAPPIGELLNWIRGQIKNDPSQAMRIAGAYGISDPALIDKMKGTNEQWAEFNKYASEATDNLNKAGPAAEQFGTSLDKMTNEIHKVWTTITTQISPAISDFMDTMTDLFSFMAGNKEVALGFFSVMVLGSVGMGMGFLRAAAGATGLIGTLSALLGVIVRVAGGLGTLGLGSVLGISGARSFGNFLVGGIINKIPGGGVTPIAGDPMSTMGYLMSKHGLSEDEAAAFVANGMLESKLDPTANGDNNTAFGAFQWHNDAKNGYRIDKIRNGTGIDVKSGSYQDSLDAAVWEYKNNPDLAKSWKRFQNANGAGAKASIFGHDFEAPADKAKRMLESASLATQLVSSYNAGGGSVNIGQVNVNTQATDAPGIASAISGHLHRELHNLVNQSSDGLRD